MEKYRVVKDSLMSSKALAISLMRQFYNAQNVNIPESVGNLEALRKCDHKWHGLLN